MGRAILEAGHIPAHSLVSYTAGTDLLVSPGWLSEVLFALFFRIGGLPLLAVFTGLVIAATHGSIVVFLKNHGTDPRWALLAGLISLSLAATHWLTRPHMFSIVGTTVTLFMLLWDRPRRILLFAPFFAIWANLHGGWLYGLVMIGCFIAGDVLEALTADRDERSRWIRRGAHDAAALAVAAVSVLANPYGFTLYKEVFAGVTSASLADNIVEYLAPNFHQAAVLPFLLVIILLVVLFSFTTKRPPIPWLVLIVVSLFFALRSARNISLFGVSAWPLIALHSANAWPRNGKSFSFLKEFARLDRTARIGMLAVPTAILMLALGLNRGRAGGITLIPDSFSSRAFPTLAVDSVQRAALDGRVFDAWDWGGYIMFAWPAARLHVDPLKFNSTTMKSYGMIEGVQPGWEEELERWQVRTIIIPTVSPLAKGLLKEPGWKLWYKDTLAVVFRSSSASQQAAGGG